MSRKHPIDILRTKIWYSAVECAMGAASAYEVELRLEPEKVKRVGNVARPRKWDGYRSGSHVPKDKQIDLTERAVPGTAQWFYSPVWQALRGGFAHHVDVEKILSDRPSICEIIFNIIDIEGAVFPRFNSRCIERCGVLSGIDLLESVILLMELGRISCDIYILTKAAELYVGSSEKLAITREIFPNYNYLFKIVERRYFPYVDNYSVHFMQPWFVRLASLETPRPAEMMSSWQPPRTN